MTGKTNIVFKPRGEKKVFTDTRDKLDSKLFDLQLEKSFMVKEVINKYNEDKSKVSPDELIKMQKTLIYLKNNGFAERLIKYKKELNYCIPKNTKGITFENLFKEDLIMFSK